MGQEVLREALRKGPRVEPQNIRARSMDPDTRSMRSCGRILRGETEGALGPAPLLLAFCPEPPLRAGLPEGSRGRGSTPTLRSRGVNGLASSGW